MEIVEQGLLNSLDQLTRLRIINFAHCNGYWENSPSKAMRAIANWTVGLFEYTVVRIDINKFPERDGWTGWNHVGHHEQVGRLFWNSFLHIGKSHQLHFSDSPDITGEITWEDGHVTRIYGDVGEISVSTFALDVLPYIKKGDLWISVSSSFSQVILEPLVDVGPLLRQTIVQQFGLGEPLPVSPQLQMLEPIQQDALKQMRLW
jgi:hypothetical protein